VPDISDDFNRANSNTTLGSPWLDHGFVWGIDSNRAYLVTSASHAIATRRDANAADVRVGVTMAVFEGGSGNVGIVVRASDGASGIHCVFNRSGPYAVVYEVPSYTQVGDLEPFTSVNGDLIEVEAVGSSIKMYKNGVEINSVTTSHNLTEIGVGLRSFQETTVRYENFFATDLGAPADPLVAGTASFESSGPDGISVSATAPSDGTGAGPTYQWERNADGGSYSNVSGATSLTLTDTTATTTGVLYRFRCKQTRGSETVTTNAVAAQVYEGGAIGSGGAGAVLGVGSFLIRG
jgi:hypothetical protein